MQNREAAATAPESVKHYPVSIELYEENDLVDIDLYIKYQKKYILYKVHNLRWTPADRKRLVENRIRNLFVRFQEKREYLGFLEKNLDKIIQAPRLPLEEKASVLYETSTNLVQDLLVQPHSTNHMQRSLGFVNNTIHYLFSSHEAFFKLLSLVSHNYYTYTHSVNVCTYTISLAQKLGIHFQQDLLALGVGALLHDIGKYRVPHRILNKPGPLTDEEWVIMRQHPTFGYETTFDKIVLPTGSSQTILQHHEKLDSRGYPKGLPGNTIHLYAKMITIADCFDAMTTQRCYCQAQRGFAALQYMRRQCNTHFDENLLTHFIHMLKKDSK